jgi:hypothetical protein
MAIAAQHDRLAANKALNLFHLHDLSSEHFCPQACNTMGTQGVVLKDLLPVPETDPTAHEGSSNTLLDAPTDSHALALDAAKAVHPAEAGAAQVQHEQEVVDLGWNEPKEHVAQPLVGGLSNEDLWLLVRRFNKVRTCLGKIHVHH